MSIDLGNLSENELKKLELKIQRQIRLVREKKFNCIDLFCGAGGLSCGLENAGFNSVLGVDIEPSFLKTYSHNHPFSKTFLGPIGKLTKSALLSLVGDKKIHLVAGGPPCQGFSTVGKGDKNDIRNSLFLEYCRIIKIIKPNYILFENVTGILSKKNEDTLAAIFSKFRSLGYEIDIKVLEAQKYGVAQRRRRAFILGHKVGAMVEFPKPTHDVEINGKYIAPTTVGDVLNDLVAADGEVYNHELKYTEITDENNYKRVELVPEGKGVRYQKDEDAYWPEELKLGVDWVNIDENRLREQKYHRLDRKLPSPTIMTKSTNYFHPIETRRFTTREFAKFQSFPNEYYFCGGVGSQMKQIGNAVPPLLAKALGQEIVKAITSDRPVTAKKTVKRHAKKIIENVRKNAFIYRESQIENLNKNKTQLNS